MGEEAGARATTARTACQHAVGSFCCGWGELRGRYLHVQRYEVQSGETLTDSLRVAEVSRHSPQNIQAALWSHIMTIGSDYQRLRTFVNDLLTSGLEYNSSGFRANLASANNAPVPMDVGNLCTGQEREHKIKKSATTIEEAKGMVRSKECPRLEKE